MHQSELESKIIYALLREPAAHDYIFDELEAEHFTSREARNIFLTAQALNLQNIGVDFATIEPRINDEKTHEYLLDVVQNQFTVTSLEPAQYVRELKRLRTCRESAEACRLAAGRLDKGEDAALYELQVALETKTDAGAEPLLSIKDAVEDAVYALGDVKRKSVQTGFEVLDKYFDGAAPGRLAILAAETSAGKSTFALNLAYNVARRGGVVLYVSLEMTANEIMRRMLANAANVKMDVLATMAETQDVDAIQDVMETAEDLKRLKMFLWCKSISAQRIVNKIKQTKSVYGRCDLVVIDYLQLLTNGRRTETREREVADISRTLALAAIQEDTCVFALSQVNRQVDARETSELFLSDIRESAAPTHDASGVFFLYPIEDTDADVVKYKLKIAKNRNGRTGARTIIFNKPKQRFTDSAGEK